MLIRAHLEGSDVVQGSHLAALMGLLRRDIHAALENGLAICSRPEAVYAQQPQSTLQQQLPVCDGLGTRYGGKPSSAAGALPGALPAPELKGHARAGAEVQQRAGWCLNPGDRLVCATCCSV